MAFQLDSDNFKAPPTVMDYMQKNRSVNAEAGLNEQKVAQAKAKSMLSVMSTITDQHTHDLAVQQLKGMGIDTSQLEGHPYDPQEVEMAKGQLAASLDNTVPATIQNYQLYKNLPESERAIFDRSNRGATSNYLNLGDRMLNPNTNQVIEKGLPPQDLPSVRGAQEAARSEASNASDLVYKPKIKAAETTAEAGAKADTAMNNTVPALAQLRKYNEGSFNMPYSDTAILRFGERVFGGDDTKKKRTNTDLMKQARTDLAAPLAKELGVNPTDRDFQATLDRIFDIDASKESRAAQIDALEERINLRKQARGIKPTLNTPIPTQKTIVKTQISPSTGKRKIIYSDGTEEIQ